MRLTVLGSSASYAGPGHACAGHLVRGGGASVLMDCGNGVLANLARVVDPTSLDAVFVTHEHPDHYADLYSLQALLRYAPAGPVGSVALHMPPGLYERVTAPLNERGRAEFAEAFDARELVDGATVQIAELAVTPTLVDHVEPTFALVVETADARLCYTADTRPGHRVMAAAAAADLLLAEATLPEEYAGAAPHMTATQAGALGYQAGALALVLTHLWPTVDRDAAAAAASSTYGSVAMVAEELDTFTIGTRGVSRERSMDVTE